MTATRRRYLVRRLLASSVLAVLIGVGVVRAFAGGATPAPPDRAAAFVPRDALVYLNVATNRHSAQWKRALAAIDKLPTLSSLRDALLRTAEGGLALNRDAGGWLGNEAAFAQLPRGGRLLVLKARDPRAAQRALDSLPASGASETYRGVALRGVGRGDVAGLRGGFALLGSRQAVHAAIDAAGTPGASLAADKTYEELRGGLPHDRLATGYLAQSWIKAHLAGPAALLSGAALVPAIQSAALSFGAGSKRLDLTLRGRPAPGRAATGCSGGAAASNLLSMAPARPALFIGLTGAECILRELTASPGSGIGAALRSFNARAQQSGVNVGSEVFPLLRSDSSLSVTPGDNGPTITLDAANVRPQQGIGVLTRLQPALAGMLQPESDGATPDISTNGVNGVNVLTSSLSSGLQLNYAAFNGDLVVSNSVDGVAGARAGQHLAQTADFNTVLEDRPKDASALVFFDLEKLLALADQAGLSSNPTYSAVRDDLQKIGAAGIVLAREGKDIDAELRLKTP
jgi:Protein of unknown function (DUF3352)